MFLPLGREELWRAYMIEIYDLATSNSVKIPITPENIGTGGQKTADKRQR